MGEADVGLARLDQRTELGHGLRCWFRPMRKDALRIIIDREYFAAQFRKPTRNQQRTSAVTTIDRNFQATPLDRLNIKNSFEGFKVVFDRVVILDGGLDVIPSSLGKLSLMKNVQKLFSLLRVQIESIAAHKLQRIPLRRIVTGSRGDTSISF